MYHQFGYKNCLETLVLLSVREAELSDSLSRNTLKDSYKALLSELQPNIPASNSLEIEFVDDPQKNQILASFFNINLQKEGIDQLIGKDSPEENPLIKIQDHLLILRELDISLYSLFIMVVNLIFCGNSSYAVGGTTSAAIGVIWGNPENGWQVCDYLEYFVHESTHTLMFLDELRFLHYKNQEIMYNPENFSLSAILQAKRPIDRVLHSIVVATEVLAFRNRKLVDHSACQIHPSTDQLIESTLKSIEALLTHPNIDNILTPRSLEIIGICQNSVSQYMALTSFS